MKQHSILFQPSMVEALLAGRKTQTRRLVSAHTTTFDGGPWPDKSLGLSGAWLDESFPTSPILKAPMGCRVFKTYHRLRPRVEIGDSLWVKEAHFALGHWVEKGELKKNGQPKMMFLQHQTEPVRFSEPDHDLHFPRDTTFGWYPRNSLFMRRKDCRLVLRVSNVRFQRLQNISESDAISEGIEQIEIDGWDGWKNYASWGEGTAFGSPAESFESMITSIKGPEVWAANRWMVAYTFEAPNIS